MTPGQYRAKADPFRLIYKDQFSPHMLRHLIRYYTGRSVEVFLNEAVLYAWLAGARSTGHGAGGQGRGDG